MSGLSLPAGEVTFFLLLLARTSAWAVTVPLLGIKGSAPIARIALGVSLALVLMPVGLSSPGAQPPAELGAFVSAVFIQTCIGLALGLLTGIILHAAEVAGTLADFTAGFAYAQMIDPVTGASASNFSRLFNLSFVAVAFATDAHHMLLQGFAVSLRAVPLDATPSLPEDSAAAIAQAVTLMLRAAIEIGSPLLGVLFLTEVVLGLVARFVPQANVIMIGLPLKALIALTAAGAVLTLLPSRIEPLFEASQRLVGAVIQ